jgi:glycosyltransferase involved in cell wall biosynthesis
MTRLVVMIPAYNEAADIAAVIDEIPRSITGVDSVEVLVIDDGSSDGTAEVARAAGADHILTHEGNRGLAQSFRDGLDTALLLGADVIVNTDADNHYDQSRIPDLIAPVVAREADIVIGSRDIAQLGMPAKRRWGNQLANAIFRFLYGLPGETDISSGYRAYSREAALRLSITSRYTYTHETLMSASDSRLKIKSIVIPARHVERPSRLMSSVRSHVFRAGSVAFVSFGVHRMFRLLTTISILLMLAGTVAYVRFFYLFVRDGGSGHVQSLVTASLLIILGVQLLIAAMFAASLARNRQLIEEVLYQQRKAALEPSSDGEFAGQLESKAPELAAAGRGRDRDI